MKKGGAKRKGSSFERSFCKGLSKWWTHGNREDVFWTTAGSGGMATNRAKRGGSAFAQYGDVQATDPIGQPFIDYCTVELKNGYNKWSVMDVMDKPKTGAEQTIEKFIKQAVEQQLGTTAAGLDINVETLPQFQEEWRRTEAQMDMQYLGLLDDYKRALKEIE